MTTQHPDDPAPSVQDSPVWPPAADPTSPAAAAQPPAPSPVSQPPASLQDATQVAMEQVWTVLSSTKRQGTWRVPAHLLFTVGMGEVRLDLRGAELGSAVTTIEVRGIMGDVKIIVPDTMRVECTGSAVLGEFGQRESGPTAPAGPGAPLVRVIGAMVLGEVKVYRTAAVIGEGAFAIDGLPGMRARRRARRHQRRLGQA